MSMNLKNDRNPSHKFHREGPKYICSKCKKKFFSKEQVEACFDQHPDENISDQQNQGQSKKQTA